MMTDKEQIEKANDIKIIRHDSLDEIVRTFFLPGIEDGELELWTAWDGGEKYYVGERGESVRTTAKDFIDEIRKNHNCWGFARIQENEIHVWIDNDDKVNFLDLLGLMAHEFGHFETNDDDIEMQSEAYCRVAVRAWCGVYQLLGIEKTNKLSGMVYGKA